MRTFASLALSLILCVGSAWAADDEEGERLDMRALSLKIQKQLQKKDLEGAEATVDAALKAHPDNAGVMSFRQSLAMAYSRAKQHEKAIAHSSAYLEFQIAQFEKNSKLSGGLPGPLNSLLFISRKAENTSVAEKLLEKTLSALAAAREKAPSPELADAYSQLVSSKISHLAETKQKEKATALLEQSLTEARRAHAADKADLGAALILANYLNARADLLETDKPEAAIAATKEYRDFLAAAVKEHGESAAMISLYLNSKMGEFYEVVQGDTDAAQAIRTDLKSFLSHLEDTSVKAIAARGNQLLTAMSRQIESSKAHLEMVGKPATELDVAAWVNGASLTDDDLKGKVVLLDFWAVWCGPCIATFPHLREWQDKYSNKGLVIIGMTNYYQYDFDTAAEAIERVEGLEPEKEQEALVKFAQHHKLKHRFAVMPEKSEFSKSYNVQGIPQVVLIDRAGKVRMIRVGSGSRNAHDLEDAIKKALDAPAPAAGG